jgi:hypothetical protein
MVEWRQMRQILVNTLDESSSGSPSGADMRLPMIGYDLSNEDKK